MMEEKPKDTVIIIPSHNEENAIDLVLKELPKDRLLAIIVVDNNSSDATGEVAKKAGAIVIREARMGYGQACLSGIIKAREFSPQLIAFIDGDYSDNPGELILLLAEIDKGYDLVIGSRTLGKAEKGALLPQAIFGNWLATFLMKNLLGGFRFSDLGPFRVIRSSVLEHLGMSDKTFGWTVEMQGKAVKYDFACTEVSVSYKKRIGVSKITGTIKGTILAGHKILKTIFKLWLSR